MTEVLVLGATGKQGGAVATRLLQAGHRVRALVRDPRAPAALTLAAAGVRVSAGDLADPDALRRAAAGTEAIFGLSVPFGAGGLAAEVAQGRLLVDTAAALDAHLVYSSVRGAGGGVEHVDSKGLIEAHLRASAVRATVLGPVYFMENALGQLADDTLSIPLSPGKRLDQVTVLDIAGLAVHAIENPDAFVGERIDLASDSLSGAEAAAILGAAAGRTIGYRHLPLEQVRRWAGEDIATMFARFEDNTDFLDLAALRAKYPAVRWHSYADWAATIDWAAAGLE